MTHLIAHQPAIYQPVLKVARFSQQDLQAAAENESDNVPCYTLVGKHGVCVDSDSGHASTTVQCLESSCNVSAKWSFSSTLPMFVLPTIVNADFLCQCPSTYLCMYPT